VSNHKAIASHAIGSQQAQSRASLNEQYMFLCDN